MLEGYLYDKTTESRLWRRVVMQAIKDSAKGKAEVKLEVREWLDTKDFEDVCHYAAVDADFMYDELMSILESPGAVARIRAISLREAILLKDGDEEE